MPGGRIGVEFDRWRLRVVAAFSAAVLFVAPLVGQVLGANGPCAEVLDLLFEGLARGCRLRCVSVEAGHLPRREVELAAESGQLGVTAGEATAGVAQLLAEPVGLGKIGRQSFPVGAFALRLGCPFAGAAALRRGRRVVIGRADRRRCRLGRGIVTVGGVEGERDLPGTGLPGHYWRINGRDGTTVHTDGDAL